MLRSHVLRAGSLGVIPGGNRPSWRELDATLRPFVARRVRSPSDVDDVVQEVLLRMHRGLASLRDDERFGPWVYQVARSAIADHQRAALRHPVVEAPAEEIGPEESELPGDDAGERFATHVAPFVAMLPSPYREALTLTELEGVSQKAAAEMTGISVSGMKSRVQRGRLQLRALLEDCCHVALDVRGRVVAFEPRPDGCVPGCCCR